MAEKLELPSLPDEAEYPRALAAAYELLECFSETGDARTLLARRREDGRLCVVKCYLRANALFDREEPEVLRRMDAAPMPRFVAEYRGEQMRCVLRDYVEGETLAALAERRSFSEEEVLAIGVQLCEQLRVLHTMDPPVIHRDLKPQNVVLRPDGAAVLIDFGIARVRTEKDADTVAFGTQGFAPPEQYGFSQTDERSDIYSLGVLLTWLLHRRTKVSRPGGSALERAIARCVCFDPARRYADVGQVKRALLAARPEARRRRRLAALAVLVLVLAAAGLFAAGRTRQRTVRFAEPLLEQAVRMSLGLDAKTPLTGDMLAQVRGIYLVADVPCPDADSFYPAVSRWYAEGRGVRGSVKSLEDLRLLPNLEQVCLAAQELEDLSPLAELEQLEKVELKHNYISDLSPLSGLLRLRSVGVNDNPVRDLSPLLNCPNLAFLDLCDVRSYDPAVLAALGNFDFLDISNPTESYRYLDGKSILDLRVAWTGLDDLHALDGVTRLERLEIDHTAVADLSPLARHTGLKVLRLTGIPAADLHVLLELPQLREVTIGEAQRAAMDALGVVPFSVFVE